MADSRWPDLHLDRCSRWSGQARDAMSGATPELPSADRFARSINKTDQQVTQLLNRMYEETWAVGEYDQGIRITVDCDDLLDLIEIARTLWKDA